MWPPLRRNPVGGVPLVTADDPLTVNAMAAALQASTPPRHSPPGAADPSQPTFPPPHMRTESATPPHLFPPRALPATQNSHSISAKALSLSYRSLPNPQPTRPFLSTFPSHHQDQARMGRPLRRAMTSAAAAAAAVTVAVVVVTGCTAAPTAAHEGVVLAATTHVGNSGAPALAAAAVIRQAPAVSTPVCVCTTPSPSPTRSAVPAAPSAAPATPSATPAPGLPTPLPAASGTPPATGGGRETALPPTAATQSNVRWGAEGVRGGRGVEAEEVTRRRSTGAKSTEWPLFRHTTASGDGSGEAVRWRGVVD